MPPHIIGSGRTARETYPGRSGGFIVGDLARLYGGSAPASAPETELAAKINAADWEPGFTQATTLPEGAILVAPGAYPIGRFSAKRMITGGGAIAGDNPIQYDLMQSVDDGVVWTPLAPTITFTPDERDTKTVSIGLTAPSEALLAVRGTYPTNYAPGALVEFVYFVIEVMRAG